MTSIFPLVLENELKPILNTLLPTFYPTINYLKSIRPLFLKCQEMFKSLDWRTTYLEETNALKKNETWELVELLEGKKTLGFKWEFTIKCKVDGSIERYNTHLVAKGFTQTFGLDYHKTFAPIAKINSIQVLLSLAVKLNWSLHQLDVKILF